MPAVNQTQAPVDAEGDGCYWHSLGVNNATSGTLVVTLTAGDAGKMLADAVTIVRYETAPTTGLAIDSFTSTIPAENDGPTPSPAEAPPFSIGIYGSPDGVRQGNLLQSYDVGDPSVLAAGTYTARFAADFSDRAQQEPLRRAGLQRRSVQ